MDNDDLKDLHFIVVPCMTKAGTTDLAGQLYEELGLVGFVFGDERLTNLVLTLRKEERDKRKAERDNRESLN